VNVKPGLHIRRTQWSGTLVAHLCSCNRHVVVAARLTSEPTRQRYACFKKRLLWGTFRASVTGMDWKRIVVRARSFPLYTSPVHFHDDSVLHYCGFTYTGRSHVDGSDVTDMVKRKDVPWCLLTLVYSAWRNEIWIHTAAPVSGVEARTCRIWSSIPQHHMHVPMQHDFTDFPAGSLSAPRCSQWGK
jgi:hypothetical protein